jgi:hypothetical protein
MALANFALQNISPLDITSGKFDPKGFGKDSGLQDIGDNTVKNYGELKQRILAANPNVGTASDYYSKMADAMKYIDPAKALEMRAKAKQAENTQQATQGSNIPSQQLVGAGIANLGWNTEGNVPIVQAGSAIGAQANDQARAMQANLSAELSRLSPTDQEGRDSVLAKFANAYPTLWHSLSTQYPREATQQNYDSAMLKGGMSGVPLPMKNTVPDFEARKQNINNLDAVITSMRAANDQDPRLSVMTEKVNALKQSLSDDYDIAQGRMPAMAPAPVPTLVPVSKTPNAQAHSAKKPNAQAHNAKKPYRVATAADVDLVRVAPTPIVTGKDEAERNRTALAVKNFDDVKTKTQSKIDEALNSIPSQGDANINAYKSLESKKRAIENPNEANLLAAFPSKDVFDAALGSAGVDKSLWGAILNFVPDKLGSKALHLTDAQSSKLKDIVRKNYDIDYESMKAKSGATVNKFSMKDLAKFYDVGGRRATEADSAGIKAFIIKQFLAPVEIGGKEKSSAPKFTKLVVE